MNFLKREAVLTRGYPIIRLEAKKKKASWSAWTDSGWGSWAWVPYGADYTCHLSTLSAFWGSPILYDMPATNAHWMRCNRMTFIRAAAVRRESQHNERIQSCWSLPFSGEGKHMREDNGHLRGYLGKPMRVFVLWVLLSGCFLLGCWRYLSVDITVPWHILRLMS